MFSHIFLYAFSLPYCTNHFTPTHIRKNLLRFRAHREYLSLLICFQYIFKVSGRLGENEILKIAFFSPFDFSGMLFIIHVSLMSSPIASMKERGLMRNTLYMGSYDGWEFIFRIIWTLNSNEVLVKGDAKSTSRMYSAFEQGVKM